MDFRQLERRIVVSTRYLTFIAVVGSLAGSLLMFMLGLFNIYEAFVGGLRVRDDEPGQFGTGAVISVIEGLDRFLIAIVLLYFGYGVYSLFIHPGEPEERFALPDWLRVKQIGQLKQVVAEVIIVVLFVLFLRAALEAFHEPNAALTWRQIASLALLPVSIVLLSLSLHLVKLHPKPPVDHAHPKPAARKDARDEERPD
ncbi:YqhA family protein [Bauldia litoralis]|uniref:Uncharacterized membrane protein YqhA n=1 Tax=Bauldia litoralis TaxID=665467 RepID=A0A1G6EAP0_9HYPH|nr:YqhA family protein [Bauldia litoralis]SDB54471.1 Uncharacterized membrane protein YqhA [Bauldia litoralis]